MGKKDRCIKHAGITKVLYKCDKKDSEPYPAAGSEGNHQVVYVLGDQRKPSDVYYQGI